MCSMYVATINLDFIGQRSVNSYQRLVTALTQVGWQYSGTSATVLLDGDLSEVLMALEVLARGIPDCDGELGALSIQVQALGYDRPAPAAENHRRALARILDLPAPSEH